MKWWHEMGPDGSANFDVYLRTAVSVETDGWANFGYVKMPEYRWGIFLAKPETERVISFGDHRGEPVWAGSAGRVPRPVAAAHRHAGRHGTGGRWSSNGGWGLPARRCTTCATCSR